MTKKRVVWMAKVRTLVSPAVYREGASFGMEEDVGGGGVEGFADGVEAFRQVIAIASFFATP